VPNTRLLPAAVLAQRINLGMLIDSRLHLAANGANSGAEGADGDRVDAGRRGQHRLTVMTKSLFAGWAGALAEEMVQLPDVGACVPSLEALCG
jgi:hypothetical protein